MHFIYMSLYIWGQFCIKCKNTNNKHKTLKIKYQSLKLTKFDLTK